jgi:hypothetical protein
LSFIILRQIKLCELCTSQELEKAHKALSLNGDTSSVYNQNLRLLGASSRKPTLWIRRLGFAGHSPNNIKLRTASSYWMRCPEELKREREKAEKAMSLNLNIGF